MLEFGHRSKHGSKERRKKMGSQTSQTGLNKKLLNGGSKMKNESENITPIEVFQGVCALLLLAFLAGLFFSMALYFYNFFNGLIGQ